MAWRICKVPGCHKRKPIQPFGTTTVHAWLCPKHRIQAQEEHINHLARVTRSRRYLASIIAGREPSG